MFILTTFKTFYKNVVKKKTLLLKKNYKYLFKRLLKFSLTVPLQFSCEDQTLISDDYQL